MVGRLVWLKWRLLVNGLRHDRQRRVGLPILIVLIAFGAWWLSLRYLSTAATLSDGALGEFAMWGALIAWLAWSTLPVMLFPVDETLDPTKFALLPIGRRSLIGGLTGAGLVTPPILVPVALTLVNLSIFITPSSAPIALAGSALLLAHLVIGTQGFSALVTLILRTRRGRDFAFGIIGLIGFGGFFLQQTIANVVGEHGLEGAVLQNPLSTISWLFPPVSAQHAIVAGSAGDYGRALLALAVAIGWILVLGRLWNLAIRRLITVPEAPVKESRSRTWPLAQPFGWSTVGIIASKELRFYWRDPRMRMVWTGGVVFLGILAASVVLGSTQLAALESSPEFTLTAPAVVLFIGLPIALNQFGWERKAASYLFALPARPIQLLIGKNLATGIALATEAVTLALIFAYFTAGWKLLIYIPPLVFTAILCQLAIGNLVSVVTPLRLPPPGGDLFAQASEQGCLALGSQLLAFAAIGLLMIPPASAFTLLTVFGVTALKWQIIFTVGSVQWGIFFYTLCTWLANRFLTRRIPEMVGAVQTA